MFYLVEFSTAMQNQIVEKLSGYHFIYLQRTYRRLLYEFLKASGIHGLKALLATPKWRYAKIVWIVFLICVIVATHFIIIELIIDYLEQPTQIRMSTHLVHVAQSPFPGVAVCSATKFSRDKLFKYAERVYEAQQSYKPGLLANNTSEMAKHLQLLGGFYVYPFDNYEGSDARVEKLHQILLHLYNSTEYPSREILRDLAPDCENLVLRGMVFGRQVNTSRYFYKRLISSSVCCMFNYRRESHMPDAAADNELIKNIENVTFESNSILNSVQFVLQNDLEDIIFTEMWNNAFQLYIFPQEDFATMQTDTLGEIFVNHNFIVEIPVQPTFYGSSASIKSFSPKVRKCYFLEEGQKLLNQSYYSLDECLLICRMQSMLKHCGCVNPPMADALINATQCTLMQLPCLTEWKKVWNHWDYFSYVTDDAHDDDDTDTSSILHCGHCLPTCTGVDYKIYVNEQPLRTASADNAYTFGLLKGLTSTKPLAIIKLFFKQRYAQSTEADIVGDWVVLLNRFGGIMALMYGFSIISYIEILYYLSGKWFYYICKAWRLEKEPQKQSPIINNNKKKVKHHRNRQKIEPTIYSLYWKELNPKTVNFKTHYGSLKWQIPNRY